MNIISRVDSEIAGVRFYGQNTEHTQRISIRKLKFNDL